MRARVSGSGGAGRTEPKVKQLSGQVLLQVRKERGKAEWIRRFFCTWDAGQRAHRVVHCGARHALYSTSSSDGGDIGSLRARRAVVTLSSV